MTLAGEQIDFLDPPQVFGPHRFEQPGVLVPSILEKLFVAGSSIGEKKLNLTPEVLLNAMVTYSMPSETTAPTMMMTARSLMVSLTLE